MANMMRKMRQSRLWKSKGGLVVMGVGYLALVLILDLFSLDVNTMNAFLGYVLVPGSLIMTAAPGQVIGAGWGVIFLSMLMYGLVGYAIDWFYKPKR